MNKPGNKQTKVIALNHKKKGKWIHNNETKRKD
jgi:hypothetical protein